ncbi:WD40-repeat-containing domain protein, partial [Rhypophila decipiens]
VWDYTANTTRVGEGHDADILSTCYAPNSEFIATCSEDRTVRLWREEVGNNTVVKKMLTCGAVDVLTSVAVTRNSEYVIATSKENCSLIYNTKTGHLVARLGDAVDSVYGVAASLNGNLLAVASLDKSILLYDIQTLKPGGLHSVREESFVPTAIMKYHQNFVFGCIFSNDSTHVFSVSKDQTVICWNVKTGLPQAMLLGHENSVIAIAAAQNQQLIATASGDLTVQVWRYSTTNSSRQNKT